MGNWKRKRVTADVHLQGKICLRVAVYWLICALTLAILLTGRDALGAGTEVDNSITTGAVLRAVASSLLILPLVLFDCLIFSNRFVGPIWRLRREVKAIANGQSGELIRFRPGDEYQELIGDFNRVIDRLAAEAKTSDQAEAEATEAQQEIVASAS